jgi:hypothetical protein
VGEPPAIQSLGSVLVDAGSQASGRALVRFRRSRTGRQPADPRFGSSFPDVDAARDLPLAGRLQRSLMIRADGIIRPSRNAFGTSSFQKDRHPDRTFHVVISETSVGAGDSPWRARQDSNLRPSD